MTAPMPLATKDLPKEEPKPLPPEDYERKRRSSEDGESFTHEELMELTTSTLTSLLESDSVLSDLPTDVTVEEVTAQIALVQGQSMSVYVVREDGQQLTVVVSQNGTVLDLKRAFQRHLSLRLTRAGRGHVKVNWRYVWRNNWLSLPDEGGVKLKDDNVKLKDVGVRNKSRVIFIKRLDAKHRL